MRYNLWVYLLLFDAVLSAQSDHKPARVPIHQIVSESVSAVAIDSKGYLWAGTSDGAIRYDGGSTIRYTNEGEHGQMLQGNYVYDLLPLEDGAVWVSTYGGGISIYQPTTNNFKTILASDDNSTIQENRIPKLHMLSGDSIVAHYRSIDYKSKGLSILDNTGSLLDHHLTEVIEPDGSHFRFVDLVAVNNNIWIPAQKLYRIDRTSMQYECIEYPFEISRWDNVRAISYLDSPDKSLILGTIHGAYSYALASQKWSMILPDVFVKQIIVNQGDMYILSTKAIHRLEMNTKKVSLVLECTQLSADDDIRLNALTTDGMTMWVATNKGLYKHKMGPQRVSVESMKTNPSESIRSIKKIGHDTDTGKSLYIERGGKILQETEDHILEPVNRVGSLVHGTIVDFLAKNQYLFATDGGIYHYDAVSNHSYKFTENTALKDILNDEPTWSIYNNGLDSILWIGTRTIGLIKYDLQTDTFLQFKHDPNNNLSLCFDRYLFRITPGLDGNLWISTDKGLSVIDPRTNTFIIYPELMDKVKDFILHHSAAGDRYMWIGSRDHGLIRYEIATKETKIYTTKDGLPFTGANRVLYDRGKVVFTTRKGICILEEETDKVTVFDQRDGIDHDDLYYSYLSTGPGVTHISGGQSTNIYHIKEDIISNTEALNPIIIEAISTSTIDTTITYHSPMGNLQLSSEEDNIVAHYTTIEYDQRQIYYRYMLQGYDDRWSAPSASTSASYSHLPGGSYRLIVQSGLVAGVWQQETMIDIDIDTYWYRTWWFYGLCIGASACILSLLSRMYIDKIKVEESYRRQLSLAELRALRTQMNPHFIFNSLNSIKSFIVENDRRNASDYLNKFSRLIRLILNHSKSDQISLADELQAIRLYIDMERLRFESFDFDLQLSEEVDATTTIVPPMIIQPYLENAIWHGLLHKSEGHGILQLLISRRDDASLLISIRDNGIGRDAAKKLRSKSALERKSHGMAITKERLQLSHSDRKEQVVRIKDLYLNKTATGTEVQIILPYQINTHA